MEDRSDLVEIMFEKSIDLGRRGASIDGGDFSHPHANPPSTQLD